MTMLRRSPPLPPPIPPLHGLSTLLVLLCCHLSNVCLASDRIDGRYSFSLTTFDPSGRLGQVERATVAASLGTPVVALCRPDELLFACPQGLPSPLIADDGTSRFCSITQHIVCTHSGVAADGRVVLAAAQKLAVEHAYTFDEEIPIEIFLEQVALLFQEYTMKAGSRPFGCELLVACVSDRHKPRLFRMDPSGAVETIDAYAILGSLQGSSELMQSLQDMGQSDGNVNEDVLLKALQEALQTRPTWKGESTSTERDTLLSRMPFLTAHVSHDGGLMVKRHEDDSSTSR